MAVAVPLTVPAALADAAVEQGLLPRTQRLALADSPAQLN
jgi:hypothetical protein